MCVCGLADIIGGGGGFLYTLLVQRCLGIEGKNFTSKYYESSEGITSSSSITIL